MAASSGYYLIRLHRNRIDLVAQQYHTAFQAGISCLAEFETVGATQHAASGLVTHKRKRNVGDRVVKQLHMCVAAYPFPDISRCFQGAQAVEPEPSQHYQRRQKQQTNYIHVLYTRNDELQNSNRL